MSLLAADALAEAGYRNLGSGRVLLAGAAAELLAGWRRWLRGRLQPPAQLAVQAPAFIQPAVLRASGYLAHFPQQVVRSRGRGPGDPMYASPAACLHWYPTLSSAPLRGARAALVEAACGRFEGGQWRFPFRLAGFHMVELVVVGDSRRVDATRAQVMERVGSGFHRLGLQGEWEAAHDAFFLDSGRGAQALQLLRDSKREYRIASSGQRIALASCNRHQDVFGRAFRIRLASGRPAHSMCLAFGLERLTAAGLLRWGPSPAGWPKALRG